MCSNYWTHGGGLTEVIGVLPSKDQADILVAKYADAVDGVYPMIDWDAFQKDYNNFWALRPTDRHGENFLVASLVSLAASFHPIRTESESFNVD